jgi:hypothetical protein
VSKNDDDRDDMDVPARLEDGWRYVVSLTGGETRYFHSSLKLAQVRAIHAAALNDGGPFLMFDGCRWEAQGGIDCAGYVVVAHVLAVGYAGPIEALTVDEAVRRIVELDAEDEKPVPSGEQPAAPTQDENVRLMLG